MNRLVKKINDFHNFLETLDYIPPLLARLSIGWIFMTSGWGKMKNLDSVIEYFSSLGIPFANLQAPLVSVIELIGGLALMFGLGTRYFSAMLIGIMVVALLTAHAEDISNIADLFRIYEFMYILIMGYLGIFGAGKLSLDHLLKKKIK